VDAIDHVFGAGGGMYSGTLASGTDDAYLVFAANAGDAITVTFNGNTTATFSGTIFKEVTNGIVEIGDVVNVYNFNNNNFGMGTDLIVQTSYPYSFYGPIVRNYVVPTTGQYAIGVASFNSASLPSNAFFTVTLSGNTASISEVPEPASLALWGLLGAAGLTTWRGRSRKNEKTKGKRKGQA
jgi:MYXO-CTERM domain-containing protein